MPRAKQRTPALRDRVVHVAVATLADGGVPGFTTRRVAERAQTSIPAVYELFGDKGGLVREVFFEGFRQLGTRLRSLADTDEPRADLERLIQAFRTFLRDSPELGAVMFSRPFADFDPSPADLAAGATVREFTVGCVRRCVDAGQLTGNPTDIAHVVLALVHGMSSQESAGWLGTSKTSVNRRWSLAVRGLLDGLA